MAEVEFTTLTIHGPDGAAVENRFWRQKGPANELAIIFPGLNYTCDMPLLYYPARLLAQRGADVLQARADYTRPAFQSLSRLEQVAFVGADAQAALQAGGSQRDYQRLVLVGKSIGTLALAFLVAQGHASGATTIWLTPLLRQPWLVDAAMQCTGPALFVAGTGDATYDPGTLARIRAKPASQATVTDAIIVEGANHSLEIPTDILRSVEIMHEIMQGVARFLESSKP